MAHWVGLGTAPLGSSPDGPLWWGPQSWDDAVGTVVAAVAAGVAFIDTAPFYGWGRAEQIVGEAVAEISAPVPVYTKCGTMRSADGTVVEDAGRDAVRADVEASLTRLGLERLDVVQVHDPDPQVPIEETWEALMGLRDEGLIAAAGLSNHDPATMERASRVGSVAVVQHQYSLLHRRPEDDGVLNWCLRHDAAFLAWAPLASGFLTDGFDLAALHTDDLRHGLRWAGRDAAVTANVRAALREIADERSSTMTHVALSWLRRHDAVQPIVG
ncbi:MAG: aldo/keto reductase, partial [Ilumatobacteraceae bacterium]